MKKRAGLARAMALDPQVLFLDEPSAGLDPLSSRLLDELILELNESLGTTFLIVTHRAGRRLADGPDSVSSIPRPTRCSPAATRASSPVAAPARRCGDS